jgi:hypothetical protein
LALDSPSLKAWRTGAGGKSRRNPSWIKAKNPRKSERIKVIQGAGDMVGIVIAQEIGNQWPAKWVKASQG